MGRYGRSTSGINSLAKMLNCLIALTLMAVLGFMAIPSFLVRNKSMLQSKGGPYNNRVLVNSINPKKTGNGSLGKNISARVISFGSRENNNVRPVKKIPPRDENKDEEKDAQE